MTLAKTTTSIGTPTADSASAEPNRHFIQEQVAHIRKQIITLRVWARTYLAMVLEPISSRFSVLLDIADDAEISDLLRLACLAFLMGWVLMLISALAPVLIWFTRAVALAFVAVAALHICRWVWIEIDTQLTR